MNMSEKEIRVRNQNLQIFLGIMSFDIKRMISSKTDAPTTPREAVRPLDDHTVEMLKNVLVKIEALEKLASENKDRRVFETKIEEICPCPHHLKHMKRIGILTLADFFWPEYPPKLYEAITQAERESGSTRQPHLLVAMLMRTANFFNRSINKHKK